MKFHSVMHISFYTENLERMLDFYVNKLGARQKVIVRWKEYANRPDRSEMYEKAKSDPEGIFYVYLEITPGQFLELFPSQGNQKPHREWNEDLGYSHFALLVDNIYKTCKEMKAAGIEPDTDISKGPSGTYQQWYHDPDGNKFEVMQYTEDSWQLRGHLE